MPTLSSLVSAIDQIIQDAAYTEEILIGRINDAVNVIAGGIRMPDGGTSPPLPDLYTSGTVATSITLPYVSLPTDYQRNVFNIYDSAWNKIDPPRGGNYYAFSLFLKQITNLSLAETGSIYAVCVKGTKLYYQGIPTAAENIGLHYYRKPTAMALDGDEADGIPLHLGLPLIKHYVLMNIYGDMLEAGVTEPAVGMKYHEKKFYETMVNLIDFIGIDSQPQYYGDDTEYCY